MELFIKDYGIMIINMEKEKKNVYIYIKLYIFLGVDNSSYNGDYFEGKK